VLVADVGEIGSTINLVPELLGGEVIDWEKRGVDARSSSVRVADTASLTWLNLAKAENGGAQKSGDSESLHKEFIIIK
jgi:hypothetical protein